MTPWWSGPSFGPFPPLAVWINVLCYITSALGFLVLIVRAGEPDSDAELAALLGLSLLIGLLWVAVLPFGLLWLFLLGIVKLARRLR